MKKDKKVSLHRSIIAGKLLSQQGPLQPSRRSARIQAAGLKQHTPRPPKRQRNDADDVPSAKRLRPNISSRLLKRRRNNTEEEVTGAKRLRPDSRSRVVQDWISEVQVDEMDKFWQQNPLVKKKRSNSSMRGRQQRDPETASNASTITEPPLKDKSAPYASAQYAIQMKDRGSYMTEHKTGLSDKSKALIKNINRDVHAFPQNSDFSSDELYQRILAAIEGKNEARVIQDIGHLITPRAESLAIRGEESLEILGETVNEQWTNADAFLGPLPQPDYAVGFQRDAFSLSQLRVLTRCTGGYNDTSPCATTLAIFFPFFTSEVKCGAIGLDVADRQNLHSQTVAIRGLIQLFRIAGREHQLHREIGGFSFSHDDKSVRVFAHYPFITNEGVTFHRYPVNHFHFTPSGGQLDHRWKAYSICRNIYDWAVTDRFRKIVQVLELIEKSKSKIDPPLYSNESGLSQTLEEPSLGRSEDAPPRPITPPDSGSGQLQTISPSGKVVKKKKKKQSD
jgi:hypothetical protein